MARHQVNRKGRANWRARLAAHVWNAAVILALLAWMPALGYALGDPLPRAAVVTPTALAHR